MTKKGKSEGGNADTVEEMEKNGDEGEEVREEKEVEGMAERERGSGRTGISHLE